MNKKKGLTLVEVLVSITVFLTLFMGILSTYYLAEKRIAKVEEYQYLENICLDIDKVYDTEGYDGLARRYNFSNPDIGAKGDPEGEITKDECESEDYTRNPDSSKENTTSSESSYKVSEEQTDESGQTYKTKTITNEITYTNYYVSYDKTITTTKKYYHLTIENKELYLDSNYNFVTSSDSYKYILTYSYSRNYYTIEKVTKEIYTYETGSKVNKETVIEKWIKSDAEEDKENEIEKLKGYKNNSTIETNTEEGSETYEVSLKSTTTTTLLTKELEEDSVNLKLSIRNVLSNYDVINDLEYGKSKYDDNYFKNYEEKTVETKEEQGNE